MRFIVISEKDEVLRISHAVMSELFDRKLALPQFAQKRIRWCEAVVSLKEGHAVAVQRVLARYIHFDAHGLLDLDRQLGCQADSEDRLSRLPTVRPLITDASGAADE